MRKYLWSALYALIVVAANMTATLFLPIPLPIKISVGTLLFGFVFPVRDRVHVYGYRWAWYTVIFAAVVNLFLATAGGVSFRVVLASFLAILISEGIDTEVFQRSSLSWLGKVYTSNAISIPLDSALFVTIAFAGVLPNDVAVQLVFGQILIKYSIAAIVGLGLVKTLKA
jgi:queuosine precursor transporter